MFGSTGWDRTNDQLINSQLHYRCATVEYSILIYGGSDGNRTHLGHLMRVVHCHNDTLPIN